MISRMPEDRSVVHPPSHCPACGSGIRWYDNVPVLSWLILRARCRDCGTPISSLYPTIELLTGCVAWLVYQRIITGPQDLDLAHGAAFVVYLLFAAMLIAQTFIDVRHYIIPDELSIYAAPFGIAACGLLGWLGYTGAPTWKQSVLGAVLGAGLLGFVMVAFWLIRRKEGMGLGDVKLLAMIGAFSARTAVPCDLRVRCRGSMVAFHGHPAPPGHGLHCRSVPSSHWARLHGFFTGRKPSSGGSRRSLHAAALTAVGDDEVR